jgi:hypothetical protein
MTWCLLALPSEFNAGLALLPESVKLGLWQILERRCSMAGNAHFLIIVRAPKTKASTSSVITASITPARLSCANSASASPSAFLLSATKRNMPLKSLTIRHSIPNTSNNFFIPSVKPCEPLFPFLLPLLSFGLFRPSNTNNGRSGNSAKDRRRKNRRRSSGFSPPLLNDAADNYVVSERARSGMARQIPWWYHRLASMPTRYARLLEILLSKPSTTARCARDLDCPALPTICGETCK